MALVEKLSDFVAELEPINVEGFLCGGLDPLADDRVVPAAMFSIHEVDSLKEVCRQLSASSDDNHKRGDVWYDPWLPKYGCVIQRTKVNAAVVKLEVIFVDGWERSLHFLPSGECIHSSVPTSDRVLHCADLKKGLEADFDKSFESEMQEAQQSSSAKRSAATNELGHQKTPQFVAAVVRRAAARVMKSSGTTERAANTLFLPRGGTTDVGLDTGGRPRDTCWPLVQAVVKQNLCCGRGLFQKAMVRIKLSLLQAAVRETARVVSRDGSVKSSCDLVDDVFFMLQVVILNIVKLVDSGYDVKVLQMHCSTLRHNIESLVNRINQRMANRYVLPDVKQLQQLCHLSCSVDFPLPDRNCSNGDEDYTKCPSRALINLSGCGFLESTTCSLRALLEWEKTNGAPESYKCILRLRTIEVHLFKRSDDLNSEEMFVHPLDDDEMLVEQVQSLITVYKKAAREWRQLPRTSCLTVEQRSREMLVMWIAFCLVHRTCRDDVPLCSEYNIALNWEDMKVAVLCDRAAITALQNVVHYIRTWNKTTSRGPLFHMTEQEPTFEFARRYGLRSTRMSSIYDCELELWEAHVQCKWKIIERKQREAVEFRAEIARQNRKLEVKESELEEEQERINQLHPYAYNHGSRARTQLRREIRQINYSIQQLETSLAKTLAVPAFPIRPFPPSKDDAMQVILC